MKKIFGISIFALITVLLLALYKGDFSSFLKYQSETTTDLGGPFESTNSNSRYALTEAIVQNHSLFFNLSLAKFASPDITKYHGRYFSIFTPGVSFLGVPLYILGSLWGLPQIFAYFLNIIAALINVFLISRLARKLGVAFYPALIGGLTFLFATNSLVYALTYTQHELSTMLVLLALLNAFASRTVLKNIELGIIFSAGMLMDIPNAYLILPVTIFVLFKHLNVRQLNTKINLRLNLKFIFVGLGLIPLLIFFGWYNYQLTGSYFKLGQTIGRAHDKFVQQADQTPDQSALQKAVATPFSKPLISTPFNTRDELNGLYILLVSNERGWLYFSPIVLIGLWGWGLVYRAGKNREFLAVIAAVILADIVSYSMFGDPWGGWAFGPRYLIPAAALLCTFTGVTIQRFSRKPLFVLIFTGLLVYSVVINSLGALTTAAIPPKMEAVNLPSRIPYTYKYNWQLIDTNFSGSLFYNLYLKKKIASKTYLYIYSAAVLAVFAFLYLAVILEKNEGRSG